jgi:hypothetical protein
MDSLIEFFCGRAKFDLDLGLAVAGMDANGVDSFFSSVSLIICFTS